MGQRANLIIAEGNKYEIYYDHWCANSLDSYLFWGEEEAVRFFRNHEKLDESGWLDTVWCEGGAVIDKDNKVLLWFGGEEILFDIPLRRLFFELMQKNWSGYKILWAYEEIADLADYVCYDRKKVIAPINEKNFFTAKSLIKMFRPYAGENYWDCIVSITEKNGSAEMYTARLSLHLTEFLYSGKDFLSVKRKLNSLNEYTDYAESENVLCSGVHIDMPGRALHFWSSDCLVLDYKRIQTVWDGFSVHCHKDKFEIHSDMTGGRLRFVPRDRRDLVGRVRQIVCRDEADPISAVYEIADMLSEQGRKTEISPAAFKACRFESDKAEKEKLFDLLFVNEESC